MALDAGKSLPRRLRRRVVHCQELRRFQKESLSLEQALRNARPGPETPLHIHGAIMHRVRKISHSATPESRPLIRWLASASITASALTAIWLAVRHSDSSLQAHRDPLVAAQTVLDAGDELGRTTASAMLAPLSEELAALRRDLDNVTQSVLASVP